MWSPVKNLVVPRRNAKVFAIKSQMHKQLRPPLWLMT